MHRIGVDEVGRGAWAGPLLVVAARQTGELPFGLKDSKLTTKKQRMDLFSGIQKTCDIGEGWVTADEIDHLGLSKSMRLATKRALVSLGALPSEVIIFDGNINHCGPEFVNVNTIISADALIPIVSAASVYAKVLRDAQMRSYDELFHGYGFDTNVGYGTRQHHAALQLLGATDIHRKSFKPVKLCL